MLKDTTGQQNTDLAAIDAAIASLQAGNPASALSTATGISSAQQAANQFEQQMAASKEQNTFENAIKQLQATQNPFQVISEGQAVFDPSTGKIIYKNPKTYKENGSGGDPLGLE